MVCQEQDIGLSIVDIGNRPAGPYTSRTCIHQSNTLREGTETVRPHPTDATKVIVTYKFTNIAGSTFVQETEMPEVVPIPANTCTDPGSIIVPDVEVSKVPRTKKGLSWVPVPGTSCYEWTRGDGDQQEKWRIVVFFRRLSRDTNKYQDIYINTNMLNSVDPNNKKFRTSYNKWILQFARRRDATYTQKVARVHWNIAERRALYAAINVFCAKFGINKFGFSEDCKLSTRQLQLMADAVNTAENSLRTAPRGVDAVRGQIISAHDKAQPKNKAIFDLAVTAVAQRSRIERGEVVPRAERKPQFAIPLAAFPIDPPTATASSSTSIDRKRKRTTAVDDSDEEPSSSELSSPPDFDNGGHGNVSEDTWITTDEEIQPDERQQGHWSNTNRLMLPGENKNKWVQGEEVSSSPTAKKARTSPQ